MPAEPTAAPALDLGDTRPIVLLDLTGVVNVFQCVYAREVEVAPYGPTLTLLPDLGHALHVLNADCRIVWCSTWGALLNRDVAAAWGLAPCPSIEPTAEESLQRDWKVLAVSRICDGWPGTLVWVEDGLQPRARQWASERIAQGWRTLLIDITETGLNPAVAHDIVEWVQHD